MGISENKMGARDLFLFNVVSVFGVSWFTSAAKMGPSQILLWIIAAFLFFIPEALIITELSTTWPIEGGLSAWVNESFGKSFGFITSWIYIVQGIIFFPAYLISAATFFAYFISIPELANNKIYICIFSIALMWIVTFLNIKSFNFSKNINRFASAFSFGIIGLLVVLALYWRFGLNQAVQTHYSLKNIVPKFSDLNSIVFFSTMIFALSGLEAPSSLVGKVKNPQKTFPKVILLSAIVVPLLWITGSTALTVIMSPDKIGLVSGLVDVIDTVCSNSGMGWFVILVSLFLFLFRIGSVNVWTLSPVVMFLEGSKGYMPKWLTKVDENSNTPKNALITQAILVSIFTVMSNSMPTVESAYWLISAMASICLFIPYMIMFAAFINLRVKRADVKRVFKVPCGIFVAIIGFIVVFASTILACLPPEGVNIGEIIKYECQLIGGPIIFIIIGYVIYWVNKSQTSSQNKSIQN